MNTIMYTVMNTDMKMIIITIIRRQEKLCIATEVKDTVTAMKDTVMDRKDTATAMKARQHLRTRMKHFCSIC